jgi:hypothetical protein
MSAIITPIRRPLHQRLLALTREYFGLNGTSLRDLDSRALADIGLDASEIDSIEAEAQGHAMATRLRVVGSNVESGKR